MYQCLFKHYQLITIWEVSRFGSLWIKSIYTYMEKYLCMTIQFFMKILLDICSWVSLLSCIVYILEEFFICIQWNRILSPPTILKLPIAYSTCLPPSSIFIFDNLLSPVTAYFIFMDVEALYWCIKKKNYKWPHLQKRFLFPSHSWGNSEQVFKTETVEESLLSGHCLLSGICGCSKWNIHIKTNIKIVIKYIKIDQSCHTQSDYFQLHSFTCKSYFFLRVK